MTQQIAVLAIKNNEVVQQPMQSITVQQQKEQKFIRFLEQLMNNACLCHHDFSQNVTELTEFEFFLKPKFAEQNYPRCTSTHLRTVVGNCCP
eukprot:4415877-Amphidinium_carterae.1